MNNLSKTLIAIALTVAVQQAGAAPAAATQANQISAEDAKLAFGDADQAVKVAALSGTEMAQTQGAYVSYYMSPAQSSYLSYSKTPSYSTGASKIGMYLISYSLSSNRAYSSSSLSLSQLAFSKAGGRYNGGF